MSKYKIVTIVVSVLVGVLIHFPEILSLFDVFEEKPLFTDISGAAVLGEVLFTAVSLYLLFWGNTLLFKFNQPQKRITWRQLLYSFVFTLAASNLLGKSFVAMHHYWGIAAIDSTLHHYLHPMRDLIISLIVTGTCYLLYLLMRQQAILVENQQLRTENLRNQFETLKNQLNPHMLFNSLNTLLALIREEPQKAQNYTGELSKVLRYTLGVNDTEGTTLSQELGFTQAYIYLIKMRYEDNLDFRIEIDEKLMQCYLPPISLQLLIENAVKHNEISSRHPLVVSIYSDCDGNLCVSNPIQPKRSAPSGGGIGLENLAKRYSLLFRREITITNADNTFLVKLPLIPQNAKL